MIKKYQAFLILPFLLFLNSGQILSQALKSSDEVIKIGVLIPDSNSLAALRGSDLAVREANERGNLNNRHFQLVTRSLEGPWGTGSKEAVDLIFTEKVWALLGSHNGRNAHIVEQAATKTSVVLISAWAGDPTLSQAFVPWFFNCVPNDDQQAESLAKEIYSNRKYKKVIVVTCNDYDSKSATNSFLRSVKKSAGPEPVIFNYDSPGLHPENLPEFIIKAEAECILLFCPPKISIKVAEQIRKEKTDMPMFGSAMILNEDILSPVELHVFDSYLLIPSGNWSGQAYDSFKQKFRKLFHQDPGLVASYAYDAMTVLLEALRNAGSNDRELIQKSLEKIRFQGVTGIIQFDKSGNRAGEFGISRIKGGVPSGSE